MTVRTPLIEPLRNLSSSTKLSPIANWHAGSTAAPALPHAGRLVNRAHCPASVTLARCSLRLILSLSLKSVTSHMIQAK